MVDSSQVGARFEQATVALFKELFPRLGFDLISYDVRRSGTQKGFDIRFQTKPHGATGISVNFFVECKGAKSINQLPLEEFEGKADQLVNSRFNADYWILLSPLRYLSNEFQENLQYWKRSSYPFAFVNWARESKDENRAGLYLDLYKHFPDAYATFADDVPENIRDTAPEYSLDDILTHLQTSLSNAYDEFADQVVFKGLIPGVRRITPQSVFNSLEKDNSRLARIRNGYYMLNSSDKFVWKVVCNDLDVRNEKLSRQILNVIERVSKPTETIWILGSPGCGKTTQMNRSAVDSAIAGYPVVLINTLDLDERARPADFEEYLRKIYSLHNAAVESGDEKPLLVFVDNPAARIEGILRLLNRFDGLEENFKCIFVLFEREVRYHQAEDEISLADIVVGRAEKIYVDHQDSIFREGVFQSFSAALDLPANERDLAREAFLGNLQISVAEAVINFCKRTNNDRYRRFAMDWIDFEEVAKRQRWESLADLYKWVSVVYQFGIALPISILMKVLTGFDENEFLDFQDFFTSDEYENLPVIVERKTLRARHELISRWHVEEKLSNTIHQRLIALLKVIDAEDALERSILTSLLGRKNLVRRYFTRFSETDLEVLQRKAAGHPLSQRLVMMMIGWIHSAKREYEEARSIFSGVMNENPNFLPAILETGKMERFLGNESEAEHIFHTLLILDVNNLHARTELAKVYQAQKRYPEAERMLQDLIGLDPENLQARTELAKVYQVQKRYPEAERILRECVELAPDDLNSRTELAKIYQLQKRYAEAEQVLRECVKLSSGDLNSRTELSKVYQVQKRYPEAERVLQDLIGLDPNNLPARTELSKVYQVQKRYPEAERVLEELLLLEPEDLQARTELSKVYQVQKRYPEAEKVLQDLIGLDPENLQARTELAKVYQVQKRYPEAEKVLLESLVIDPQQLHPRTELAKVYQVQKRYPEAERVLEELLLLEPEDLQARTELSRVYQEQKRYPEAEKRLKEYLELDPKGLQPRTELARVYIKQGLFRKGRAEISDFLRENEGCDPENIAHQLLAYLNACYGMRRHEEGVSLIARLGCQFVSPELAEEYGRLLRSYDLTNAVKFFQTASVLFSDASRLFSEAAICFKLAGGEDAEAMLDRAIQLAPEKESKYRDLFTAARQPRPMEFSEKDCTGVIVSIDEKTNSFDRREARGTIKSQNEQFQFRSTRYVDELFKKLTVGDQVFFDISTRGFALNVEPHF